MRKLQKGFTESLLLVGLVIILVIGSGYYVYHRNQINKANSTANLSSALKTAKSPGVISTIQFSITRDKDGKATVPATTFSADTKQINVVVDLKNAKKDSRIEYVRYRNNKFVDNGSALIVKDGARYAGFTFNLKPGKTHPKGTYKVKVYTNGIYERSSSYSVY